MYGVKTKHIFLIAGPIFRYSRSEMYLVLDLCIRHSVSTSKYLNSTEPRLVFVYELLLPFSCLLFEGMDRIYFTVLIKLDLDLSLMFKLSSVNIKIFNNLLQ